LQRAYEDLRQTQQAILQQERLRALGQMASGIAHDINNAVSPVALYTDLLLETEPNLSEQTRRYLETTQRAIEDFVLLPRADDSAFAQQCFAAAQRLRIDLFVPLIVESEFLPLDSARELFESIGCRLVVPPP